MQYILQGADESARLRAQSCLEAYDLETELSGIELSAEAHVLEVGCGAGSLIEYLHTGHGVRAAASDLDPQRVDECRRQLPDAIECFQYDFLKAPPPAKYDHIFLRYVAHHIGVELMLRGLEHLRRGLRDGGGRLTCIDADGILINLGTSDPILIEYIERIRRNFSGDVEIASKMPDLMSRVGFAVQRVEEQTVSFSAATRVEEVNQWRWRFENAREAYTRMLGSEADYAVFVRLYLQELSSEQVPYSITKFIVTASV